MTCPVCDPVVTVDTEGNYIRTTCRVCGQGLDDAIAEVELTPAQKGAVTRAANKAAAELTAAEEQAAAAHLGESDEDAPGPIELSAGEHAAVSSIPGEDLEPEVIEGLLYGSQTHND